MILKKPYAFLIKYFKLIHVCLVLLMSYLLYRTNVILNFFQQYISSNQLITNKDFTGELFNFWMFALPFIIGVILIILLGVMYYKKKPLLFYVYNILIMIAVLVFYNIGYNMAGTLETQVVAMRSLRLVRDLFMIVILFQGIGVVFTFIRATGFDIKKFDFGQDLEELDITEADNEEFEVDVDIETNVLKREMNKNFRFAKYVYIENKFIINIVFLIVFSVICFTIYMNLTIYNKSYNQNEMFLATDFTMAISDSYLTSKSYNGDKITDNYLVVVELSIKANYANDLTFNTTKAELKVGNHTYHPSGKNKSNLLDLGTVYDNSVISQAEFEKILLVYEIPKSLSKEKMFFSYIDNIEANRHGLNPKYIKVKINPYELDKDDEISKSNLNEAKELNYKILKSTSIYLTAFEMKERFKVNYKYCDKDKCYDSVEYLNPYLNTNYDKALLRIDGTINLDSEFKNKYIYDLYTVIHYFGKIRYEVNGVTKYYSNMKKLDPTKFTLENSLYIEIPKEIMNAKHISLLFDIRDKSYEYTIK